jgi:NADH-quinone oxidoreductase subunit C
VSEEQQKQGLKQNGEAPAEVASAPQASKDTSTVEAERAPENNQAKPAEGTQTKSADEAKGVAETQETPTVKPAAAARPRPAAKPAAGAAEGAGDGAAARPAAARKAPPPPDPRVEAAKAKAEEIKKVIHEEFRDGAVVETGAAHHHPMLLIRKEDWADVVDFLKRHPDYKLNYLECMAGTDYPNYIEIVVYLQSIELGHFICLKTRTDRDEAEVPSLVSVHPGANWEEREIYDLLGVKFTNHPDLRRIMLWDEFKGHPLRKDYNPWEQ